MVLQPKWHTSRRNLKIGDIVLVQDANIVRGKWQMARIIATKPSIDGKVRRVSLYYRTETGLKQKIERAVQRLVLLVPVNEEL